MSSPLFTVTHAKHAGSRSAIQQRSMFKGLSFFVASLLCLSCGDDALPTIDGETKLPPLTEATITPTALGQTSGHWEKSRRAVAIDQEDFIVLNATKDRIEDVFSQLVINVPLIDKRTREDCLTGMRANDALPAFTVPRILDEIKSKGFSFEKVVVQVDLLSYDRTRLYHQCIEESGASAPSFFLEEIREETLEAFRDLARIDDIDAVVIGLELNAYSQLENDRNVNRIWDYVNLIDLYHEVYTEMKDLNTELSVGPSISWTTLKLDTLPAIAEEFDLDPADLLTFELGLRRTIWPLLTYQGEASADFLGVSLIPRSAEPPYLGTPTPETPTMVDAYYQNLDLLSATPSLNTPLPIAFTMVDWLTSNNANGGQKTDYLITLKRALSRISPEWVAWRRLSNIPEEPPQTSPCGAVMNRGYEKDFCYAGLLDYNGQPRSVWEEFIKESD